MEKTIKNKGLFIETLTRRNPKILQDRATAILRKAELNFRRTVEDIAVKIEEIKTDLSAMLDLSPTSADSLKLASDFDENFFTKDYIALGIKLRNEEIKLEIASKQFEELFGKKINLETL